jgi:hypothetical protein
MARQHELRLRRELEIRTIVCEQHRQTIIYHETQSWVKMGGSKSNNRMSRHSRCGRCTGARGWKRCRARPPQPAAAARSPRLRDPRTAPSRLHSPSAIPSQRCLRAPTTSPSRRRRRNASPSAALLAEHARSRGRENGLLRLATVCNSAAVASGEAAVTPAFLYARGENWKGGTSEGKQPDHAGR